MTPLEKLMNAPDDARVSILWPQGEEIGTAGKLKEAIREYAQELAEEFLKPRVSPDKRFKPL